MKFNEIGKVAEEYEIGKGGGEFYVLEKGDNKVRIVSDFEVVAKHWVDRRATPCVGKDKGCVFCNVTADEEPNKPSVKFLLWVIDRRDGELKIAELGWTVINAISELQEDDEYKFTDLPPYDVNIKKTVKGTGSKPSDTEYTVIAARENTELTEEEKAKIAELTPISEIVERIQNKQIKEYDAMGIGPASEDVPPHSDEDVPPGEE